MFIVYSHCTVLYCTAYIFSYTACLHMIAFNKNNFATNCFHFRYALTAFITLISSFSINFRTQYLEKYISYFNKIYTVKFALLRSFDDVDFKEN